MGGRQHDECTCQIAFLEIRTSSLRPSSECWRRNVTGTRRSFPRLSLSSWTIQGRLTRIIFLRHSLQLWWSWECRGKSGSTICPWVTHTKILIRCSPASRSPSTILLLGRWRRCMRSSPGFNQSTTAPRRRLAGFSPTFWMQSQRTRCSFCSFIRRVPATLHLSPGLVAPIVRAKNLVHQTELQSRDTPRHGGQEEDRQPWHLCLGQGR